MIIINYRKQDISANQIFYQFIFELKTLVSIANPTPTHIFFRKMDNKGKILRLYTQNIDGLETKVGLDERVIQLHGNLEMVVCTVCRNTLPFSNDVLISFAKGKPPSCLECIKGAEDRQAAGKRKRSSQGILRPDIVLYNEEHPKAEMIWDHFVDDLHKKPDLLIVIGTSLKIPGIKRMITITAGYVKRKGGLCIYIDRNVLPTKSSWRNVFDYHLLGDSDDVTSLLGKDI